MNHALLLENIDPVAGDALRVAGWTVDTRTAAMTERHEYRELSSTRLLGIRSKTKVTAELLEFAPDLDAVAAFCIGTDQIDLDAATARGVAVFNAPYANTRSVVELAVAEMIALCRQLVEKSNAAHAGTWDKSASGSRELRGRTLGIVGYGSIGSQLSVVAEALGMNVVYFDLVDKQAIGNARRCETLDELLSVADVVSLHVDGRPGNRSFFGEAQFDRMRQGSVLLNLSRGFLVDYDALRERILDGRLLGAAVDVFPIEPRARGEEFSSVLQGLRNVILTPHIGGSTQEAQREIANFVVRKVMDYARTGATTMSANFPRLDVGPPSGPRLCYLHRNEAGALADLNRVLASAGLNVAEQRVSTSGAFGYAVTDVDGAPSADALSPLRGSAAYISARLITS
jgi:D-3-phosphoglycerate dehydrogenase